MSLYGTGRREGILAVLLLMVLAFASHAPGLLRVRGPAASAPAAAAEEPPAATFNERVLQPTMAEAREVWRSGALPLWNPYARFGEPFAFSGVSVIYPGYWPLAIGGRAWLPWLLAAHAALAAAFAYRMLRALACQRYTAFLCGALWGCGWFLHAASDRLPEAAAAALLPLVVEMLMRTTTPTGSRRTAVALGLALALQVSTGGFGTARATFVLAMVLGGLRALCLFHEDRVPLLRRVGLALVLGATLSSPCWLPLAQHAGEATLAAEMPAQGDFWSRALALLLLGQPASPQDAQAVLGLDPQTLLLFPGSVLLVLAVLGLLRPAQAPGHRAWLGIAVFALGLTWVSPGGDPLAFLGGPPRPGSTLVLWHLGLLMWGGLALEGFLDAPPRSRVLPWFLLVGVLAVAAAPLLVVATGLSPAKATDGYRLLADALPLAGHLLAMATAAGLMVVWHRLGVGRLKTAMAVVAIGQCLSLAWTHGAPAPRTAAAELALAALPGDQPRVDAADDAALAAVLAQADPTRHVDSHNEQVLRRTQAFLDLRQQIASVAPGDTDELGAVAQVDVRVGEVDRVHRPGFAVLPAAPAAETTSDAPGLVAAQRTRPMPWARIVQDVVPAVDADAAALVLRGDRRRWNDRAVIEGTDLEPPHTGSPAPTVEVVERGAGRVRLRADLGSGSGYLVLAEATGEHWRCRVDGEPVPIRRANLAFPAVWLPEGSHEVDLRYSAWAWHLGVPLALFGALLALLALVLPRRRAG